MATANEHIDAGSRFWTETQHGGPTDGRPFETTAESVHEDATSAYREATSRAERDEQIERAKPDIEFHQALHGSLGSALEFDRAASQGLRDPEHWHSTATHLHRTFAKRPPTVLPPKEPDEEPPDYLDDRAKDEWHREQAAARAYRDIGRQKAYEADVAAAAPQIAQLMADHPNVPINELIAQGSAAKQALEVRPDVAWKLAKYGAAPADERHAVEMAQTAQATAQADQWEHGLLGRIEQAKQEGRYAGVERQYAEPMADFFQHLAATSQHVDYATAWDAAAQYANNQVQAAQQEEVAMHQKLYGEIIPSGKYPELQTPEGRRTIATIVKARPGTGDWEQDLADAHEAFRERQHDVAEKARSASRSISGSSGGDVRERDDGSGSIEDSVRSAYRSVATSGTHV